MNVGNANKNMFDIRGILKEISGYASVPKEKILDFILQEKKDDSAFFYYRNMLLQLVDIDGLENEIFTEYNEYSDHIRVPLEMGYGESKALISKDLQRRQMDFHRCMNSFCYGETDELKRIIEFARSVAEIDNTSMMELETLCKEWGRWSPKTKKIDYKKTKLAKLEEEKEGLKGLRQSKQRRIVQRKINILEQEIGRPSALRREEEYPFEMDSEEELELLRRREKDIKGFRKFTQGFKIRRKIQEVEEEIAINEGYDAIINEEMQQQAQEKEKEMRALFEKLGKKELGDKFIHTFLENENAMHLFVRYATSIPRELHVFENEVYSITQTMSCLTDCIKMMDDGADLLDICKEIRTQMSHAKCRSNNDKLEIGLRKRDIPGTNIISERASKADSIEKDFGDLNKQFQEVLTEKSEEGFIKKCARFHFDFVKVHPFNDANGRTARILMSMMFATRNYIFPSLYVTSSGKDDVYRRSDKAVQGDYSLVEQAFFERLGHFYPFVLPKIEKQVTRMDLIENYEGVSSVERKETLEEMKGELSVEHSSPESVRED